MINEYIGEFSPHRKFYITDTSDLDQIEECTHGSNSVTTVHQDYGALHSDDN